MKRFWIILVVFLFLFFFWYVLPVTGNVFAQETSSEETVEILEETEEIDIPELIRSDDSVAIGKNIIFAVDGTVLPQGIKIRDYLWEFGDGEFGGKEEVTHIFRSPGRYNVKLRVTYIPTGLNRAEVTEYTKEVFAFERSLFLITDLKQSPERIEALTQRAEEQGVYLKSIRSDINLRLKGQLLQLIEQDLADIQNSDTVIIWSDRVDMLSVLNGFSQRLNMQQKDLVVVTDGNIGLLTNILSGVYSVLEPERIIITRREAIDELFTTTDEQDVVEVIRSRGYDLQLLDQTTQEEFDIFALPSYGMSYLQGKGVQDSVILLVLFLPVVVTLVTFLRVVIGLSSIGVRIPLLFTYTFLVLGWWLGIVSIVVLASITSIFRRYLFKSHLLYIAKVGVLTSILGVVLLFIMGAGVYGGWVSFDFSSALMLVILAGMIDHIAGVEGNKGAWSIIQIFLETIVIASLGYLLISWDTLQVLLIAHPEVLILFIVANVFMGRFTGLRLMEYFRFREILHYTEE